MTNKSTGKGYRREHFAPWGGITLPPIKDKTPGKAKKKEIDTEGQWLKLTYKLWYDKRFRTLSRESQLIYLDMKILCEGWKNQNFKYPGKRAKDMFNISKNSLTRYISELEKAQLIAVIYRSDKKGKANRYKLLGNWDDEGWRKK